MLRESPSPTLIEENENEENNLKCSLIQLDFVKSPLTVNPCMVNIKINIYIIFIFYINNIYH